MESIQQSPTEHYNELFAVTNFIRNSAQPKNNSAYNVWITRGFGKIGVIHHGSNIPENALEMMADPEIQSFNAIVRIVQEINPSQNTGTLLLHLISLVEKAKFNFLNDSAFTSTLKNGSVILDLNDRDLKSTLLWTIYPQIRANLLSTMGANLVIPNVSEYVRGQATINDDLRRSLSKSDKLISYLKT